MRKPRSQYWPVVGIAAVFLTSLLFGAGSPTRGEQTQKVSGNTVKVAGIILKWVRKEPETNYRRAEPLIREAAAKGAKIVCTTESFLDGYSVQDRGMSLEKFHALAENIPGGKYITKLQKLADELDIYLIAGVLELDGDKTYNSAVLIGPDGRIVGKHRKKILQWEAWRNTPGDAFNAFQTPYGKIGIMICSDRTERRTIEELKRNGAELVFCPSGGAWGEGHDQCIQQRSKEGRVPIVFVHPRGLVVTGSSGEILERSEFGGTAMNDNKNKPLGGVVRLYDLELKPGSQKSSGSSGLPKKDRERIAK